MILAAVNAKGGTGKSLVALHLAGALHERGQRVCLVDLDDANATSLDVAAAGRLPFLVTDAAGWDQQHQHERWDSIVLDTYARATGSLDRLARLADLLIVPTACDAASLRVLARFLPDVQRAGAPYRVLLNAVPARPSRDGARARASLTKGGVPTFQAQVPASAAFRHAMRQQRLAWDLPRGNRWLVLFHQISGECGA